MVSASENNGILPDVIDDHTVTVLPPAVVAVMAFDQAGLLQEKASIISKVSAICTLLTRRYGVTEEQYNEWAKTRIELQARMGKLLAAMPKNVGGEWTHGSPLPNAPVTRVTSANETLSEIGVSKKESSRWQELAKIPEEARRDYYQQVENDSEDVVSDKNVKKKKRKRITTSGLVNDYREQIEKKLEETADRRERDRLVGVWSTTLHRMSSIMVTDHEVILDCLFTDELDNTLRHIRMLREWLTEVERKVYELKQRPSRLVSIEKGEQEGNSI